MRDGTDITLVKLTPAHLDVLREMLPSGTTARLLVVGGNALSAAQLAHWRRTSPHTRIVNEYGPTETVVGSTVYEVPSRFAGARVPIGTPIANTQVHILAGGSLGGEGRRSGRDLHRGCRTRARIRRQARPHRGALCAGSLLGRTGCPPLPYRRPRSQTARRAARVSRSQRSHGEDRRASDRAWGGGNGPARSAGRPRRFGRAWPLRDGQAAIGRSRGHRRAGRATCCHGPMP